MTSQSTTRDRRGIPSGIALAVSVVAGFLNRRQQDAIEYLREENRVLREQLGGRRLAFTDEQRRRLAIKGKELGRALLEGVATLVTPDTILRWHRRLVAAKWTFPNDASPRRGLMRRIAELALRFARDNPTWGYDRIQGALKNVGHVVGATTIKRILRKHGIDPAPGRGKRTPWRTFLKAHASSIAATDFFTTEVWTLRGLVTHYVLFVIDHATRAVEVVGATPNPCAIFMDQAAKTLTDPVDGFLRAKRFLIMDRDGIFSDAYRSALRDGGVRPVRTPARAPNCNAVAERFISSFRREVEQRMIFFGAKSLDRALREYVAGHYRRERNHQGLGNELIDPEPGVGAAEGAIERRERLGGLLNYYFRRAA